jgi:hypothetical protein
MAKSDIIEFDTFTYKEVADAASKSFEGLADLDTTTYVTSIAHVVGMNTDRHYCFGSGIWCTQNLRQNPLAIRYFIKVWVRKMFMRYKTKNA